MRKRKLALWIAIASGGSAVAVANGQTGKIKYKINGGTATTLNVNRTPPFSNITISVGNISTNTDIHIFDDLSDGSDSVGLVTLQGTCAANIPVRVLVADEGVNVNDAFERPSTESAIGMQNFGGLQFIPPAGSTDDSLRRQAFVNVNIRGDIFGDIVAGQVFRVDARRASNNLSGGTISGNVTSVSRNETNGLDASGEFGNGLAIGYVRAQYLLSGNVTADVPIAERGAFSVAAAGTQASIGRVVVGPTENVPGIRGDIKAEYGRIDAIYSTGQIGESSAPVEIVGGVRVGLIKTRQDEASGGAPLNQDIFANIECSAREVVDSFEASSRLIETEGDFVGDINLHNYNGFSQLYTGEGLRDNSRRGIFIGGAFIGNINVKYNWEYGDMIARSFRGNITVGQMLKGSIVAVGTEGSSDPLDGTVSSVTVGYQEDLSQSPRQANGRGFSGIGFASTAMIPPPFEGIARDAWYTNASNDSPSNAMIDGVIRAEKRIGAVQIYRMSKNLALFGGKNSKPRIEAPQIGSLAIDRFDFGVVWSGKLNSPAETVTNLIADDYVSIDTVNIGCMSSAADVWMQDFSTATFGNLFGEVHVPSMSASQVIRVDGRFGDYAASITNEGCASETPGEFVLFQEDSPRALWTEIETNSLTQTTEQLGNAAFGRILLRNANSFAGQIIIDAANTTGAQRPSTHLLGDVIVGSGTASPEVFSTNATRATAGKLGPAYTAFPSTFGGGAVGIVPFGVHVPFSQSLNAGLLTSGLNAPYTCDQVTQLEFYGPVVAPTLGSLPVEVKFDNPGAGGALSVASIMEMQGVPNDRRIAFRVTDPYRLPNATYTITRISDPNSLIGLLCDVPLQPSVAAIEDNTAPAGFDYLVDRDCDLSCQPNTCLDVPWFFCNDIDFNNDGLFPDDNDLVDYLIVLAGGPCSTGSCDSIDFNNDGLFPSDTDLIAFLEVKAGGDCIVIP